VWAGLPTGLCYWMGLIGRIGASYAQAQRPGVPVWSGAGYGSLTVPWVRYSGNMDPSAYVRAAFRAGYHLLRLSRAAVQMQGSFFGGGFRGGKDAQAWDGFNVSVLGVGMGEATAILLKGRMAPGRVVRPSATRIWSSDSPMAGRRGRMRIRRFGPPPLRSALRTFRSIPRAD
jgi:hypothetical protein